MENKRQTILIILTVAALIWVLGDFLWTGSTELQKKPGNAITQQVVKSVKTKLSKGTLSPLVKQRMTLALTPWMEDPFLERHLIEDSGLFTQEKTEAIQKLSYIYSGFVSVGKKLFPIINGREYAVGEFVDETNLEVFKVTNETVILKDTDTSEEKPRLITIPIEQEPIFEKSSSPKKG